MATQELLYLELVREALTAVVSEMRANMIHASYSSVIYEGHDFSCALMSAQGEQVTQGLDDHPLHIFAVPTSTQEVLKRFAGDVHEGDIFLHNDPYTGGTHLNDILMLWPVFAGGELLLFAAVRAHWNDVGGMTAGSISGRVAEIYQEGIRIPPMRIAQNGVLNEAVLELMFANMRIEHERRGDFECMLGVCRKAELHVHRLADRWGADGLLSAMAELMDRSERRMRERLASLPAGTYRAEGYLESNGHVPDPLCIALTLHIGNGEMVADFTGTSPQTMGPTNVGPSMAPNGVFTITKAFLDPQGMINSGAFRPIRIVSPPGTFINARLPAPCGGMVEVKYGIDAVVSAALGQAMPHITLGELKGAANHTHIAGRDPATDLPFILYEWPAGGTGAARGLDGNNVVRTFTEGDFNSIHSAEVIEAMFPLRVRRSQVRTDSAGPGMFRGGFGLVREIELLGPAGSLSVLSERNVIPPYGVEGGQAASPNGFAVLRGDAALAPSPIPGKVSGFGLQEGDVVRTHTGGGGGYGDPLQRDPARVLDDVTQGYLTAEAAARDYGVVLHDGAVDPAATEQRRTALAAERPFVTLEATDQPSHSGVRRLLYLAPGMMAQLGLAEGALVELVAERGSAIRFWAAADESLALNAGALAPDSLALLRTAPGTRLALRALNG